MRREILQLRKDPAANAAMAGVLTRSNSFKLTGALGRRPSDGELYIAHFLGAGGASRLISNVQNNPQASAVGMFPRAAAANRSIFYDRGGNRAQRLAGLCRIDRPLRRRRELASGADACWLRAAVARRRSTGTSTAPPMNIAAVSLAPAGQVQRVRAVDGDDGSRKPRARHRRTQLALSLDVPGRRTRRAGGVRRARALGERQSRRRTEPAIDARMLQRPPRVELTGSSASPAAARICSATGAACSAASACRARLIVRFASQSQLAAICAVNETSTIPKIYGERFVKRRPLE